VQTLPCEPSTIFPARDEPIVSLKSVHLINLVACETFESFGYFQQGVGVEFVTTDDRILTTNVDYSIIREVHTILETSTAFMCLVTSEPNKSFWVETLSMLKRYVDLLT
jgi:hypothetical protein